MSSITFLLSRIVSVDFNPQFVSIRAVYYMYRHNLKILVALGQKKFRISTMNNIKVLLKTDKIMY